jgi:D-alanyl-D-alanine carboxypeptidase
VLAGGALLSGSLASCSPPPVPQPDLIDAYIADQMVQRHSPGLALAVVQHGKPVKVRGYGLANLELNVPVTPETVFLLA